MAVSRLALGGSGGAYGVFQDKAASGGGSTTVPDTAVVRCGDIGPAAFIHSPICGGGNWVSYGAVLRSAYRELCRYAGAGYAESGVA